MLILIENYFNIGEGNRSGDSSGEDDSDEDENGGNSEVGDQQFLGISYHCTI